ncbi:MAG: hypothetical protein Q8O12_04605 [Candidatus Omnitrophota bacterium]|nr:hypothetical protein [Candidatus Omnitrophota bacterium]
MSRILRILAAVIVITAVGISLSYAETIWEKRQKALNAETQPKPEQKAEETVVPDAYNYDEEDIAIPTENTTLDPTDPYNITVPTMYGSIIDSYKGTNGKLIIHIQDAHVNYEAQKNISSLIESINLDNGVKLILKEGNTTDKDYAYLRNQASLSARTIAAEKLLKDATITGVEYFTLTTDYPVNVQGIEDKALYDENKNLLWAMDGFKGAMLEYVNKVSKAAEKIKEKLYNQDLLALDTARKDYENETIDLIGYYRKLDEAIQKKGMDISEFIGFKALMNIDGLEKKIDFAKINDNTATAAEKELYKEYQDGLKNLNVNKVFKEELQLESKVLNAIAENDDQKKLLRISKAISILEKMLNVKLVPEEYSYFISNKQDFDPKMWVDFLKGKSDGLDLPDNHYVISNNLPSVEKFYAAAGERDRVFVKKSEERMDKDNTLVAVLIAGGFHTPALTNLLSEKGYSYVVISPRVTTKTDDNLYRSALKND